MLSQELEKLIRDGKARYKSYAVGGSGVGTIPVQANEKIVITDFTWFPFCDVDISSVGTLEYFPVVTLAIQIIAPGVVAPGDSLDVYLLLVNIGTLIVTDVTGNLVTGYVISGDVLGGDNFIDTTSMGIGQIISITPKIIVPGDELFDLNNGNHALVQANSAAGNIGYSPGTLTLRRIFGGFFNNDFLTTIGFFPDPAAVQNGSLNIEPNIAGIITEALASSIHHLRFKSEGVEAVFNFRDIPAPIIQTLDGEDTLVAFSFPDPIQIHTYIECPQTVQIDIWKFSPSGNVFTQTQPAKEAGEPAVPNGYDQAVANPPVTNILTGQGATIIPLGTSRDPGAVGPRQHNQFYDDIGDLTELALPLNNQSFPLVNIGYVLINDFRP